MASKKWQPRFIKRLPGQRWHRIKQLVGSGECHEATTLCGRTFGFAMDTGFLTRPPHHRARCRQCERSPDR